MIEHSSGSAASRPVTVVGGSVTGLYSGMLLARGGRAVTLLEGASHWAPEPRTLIVTRRMRDLLGKSGDRSVVNIINRFELMTNGRVATVPLSEPDLVVERSVLHEGLVEQALAAGVKLRMGCRVRTLRGTHDGVALEVGRSGKTEELNATTVIGADGTFSRVAHAAGWPAPQTVPLVQAIVRLPQDLPPDTTRVWFQPDDTPYFYWLIPESPTQGVLGLIGEEGSDTRQYLEQFLERHHLEPLEFQAARIPRYTKWLQPLRRLGGADIYLVGDAAAHVKVTTVGGIVTGFRGALGVAETILQGRSSRVLRGLRWELDWHRFVRRTLGHFSQSDYEVLLDVLNPEVLDILGTHTRDEAGRILVRLCLAQPRLISLALRSLI